VTKYYIYDDAGTALSVARTREVDQVRGHHNSSQRLANNDDDDTAKAYHCQIIVVIGRVSK